MRVCFTTQKQCKLILIFLGLCKQVQYAQWVSQLVRVWVVPVAGIREGQIIHILCTVHFHHTLFPPNFTIFHTTFHPICPPNVLHNFSTLFLHPVLKTNFKNIFFYQVFLLIYKPLISHFPYFFNTFSKLFPFLKL